MNRLADMFPVCTGINRIYIPKYNAYEYVPCMHRDKPLPSALETVYIECSLYAQG